MTCKSTEQGFMLHHKNGTNRFLLFIFCTFIVFSATAFSKIAAAVSNEAYVMMANLQQPDHILVVAEADTGLYIYDSATDQFISYETPWYKQYITALITMMIVVFVLLFYIRKKMKQQETKTVKVAVQKIEENFKFALWGSGDEIWEWDVQNDELIRTNPIELIDYSTPKNSKDQNIGHMKNVLELIHPEERDDISKALYDHLKGESPYFESYFRLKSKNGGYIWTLSRARVVERDEQGQALRLLGSIKDITLIKATEDKLTLIAKAFENTMDGISILDPSFKSVLNNQAFYKITGLSLSETINQQYFFSEQSLNHEQFQQIKISLKNFIRTY